VRTIRSLAAAAIAAAAILPLAACAPAGTPEEQAIAEFKSFVEATANGGDLNACEGREDRLENAEPSRLPEGSELTVRESADEPGRFDISALVLPAEGGDDFEYESSLWIQIDEGEEPCVMENWGFTY
jgi:hypothetical protein